MAGDTLGAYGGLHRFRNIRRVLKLNDNVLVTYTGDVADFQNLRGMTILCSIAFITIISRILGRSTT